MTCIAAIATRGAVHMVGDALASSEDQNDVVVRRDEKVFRNGPLLVGFCGSYRLGQLVRYAFVPPDLPSDPRADRGYLVVDVADALRQCLSSRGALKTLDSSSMLVGLRGRLYTFNSELDVGEFGGDDVHYAIGTGGAYALGSLQSTRGTMPPLYRLAIAMDAAATYVANVRGPYTFLDSDDSGEAHKKSQESPTSPAAVAMAQSGKRRPRTGRGQ